MLEAKETVSECPTAKTPFAQKAALSRVMNEPRRARCQTQGGDKTREYPENARKSQRAGIMANK